MSYSFTSEGLASDLDNGNLDLRVKKIRSMTDPICHVLSQKFGCQFVAYIWEMQENFKVSAFIDETVYENKKYTVSLREDFIIPLATNKSWTEKEIADAISKNIDEEKIKSLKSKALDKVLQSINELEEALLEEQKKAAQKDEAAKLGIVEKWVNQNETQYWKRPFAPKDYGVSWMGEHLGHTFYVESPTSSKVDNIKQQIEEFVAWLDGFSIEEVGEKVIKSAFIQSKRWQTETVYKLIEENEKKQEEILHLCKEKSELLKKEIRTKATKVRLDEIQALINLLLQ